MVSHLMTKSKPALARNKIQKFNLQAKTMYKNFPSITD